MSEKALEGLIIFAFFPLALSLETPPRQATLVMFLGFTSAIFTRQALPLFFRDAFSSKQAAAVASESVTAIKTVRLFAGEQYEMQR